MQDTFQLMYKGGLTVRLPAFLTVSSPIEPHLSPKRGLIKFNLRLVDGATSAAAALPLTGSVGGALHLQRTAPRRRSTPFPSLISLVRGKNGTLCLLQGHFVCLHGSVCWGGGMGWYGGVIELTMNSLTFTHTHRHIERSQTYS